MKIKSKKTKNEFEILIRLKPLSVRITDLEIKKRLHNDSPVFQSLHTIIYNAENSKQILENLEKNFNFI